MTEMQCAVRTRGEAQDRFFIADSWGRKIEDEREQERLRATVALIMLAVSLLAMSAITVNRS